MSGWYPKHVRMMPKTCPNDAQNMPEWCPKHVQIIPKTCPNYDQNMSKWCPKHVWMMPNTCLNDAQYIYDWCPIHLWLMPNTSMRRSHIRSHGWDLGKSIFDSKMIQIRSKNVWNPNFGLQKLDCTSNRPQDKNFGRLRDLAGPDFGAQNTAKFVLVRACRSNIISRLFWDRLTAHFSPTWTSFWRKH